MRWIVFCLLLATCSQYSFGGDCAKPAGDELSVFSNNVGIFPAYVLERYPDKLKQKKSQIIADEEARAALLAKSLIDFEGDPDVLLLQEIWSFKARDVLMEGLSKKYPFCEHPPLIGIAPLILQQSGLMVFSKYPLSGFKFKVFTKGIGLDKLANKGIAGVQLVKDGKKAAIFTTHLQAGGKRAPEVKPDQLRECNEFIRDFTKDDEEAVIILAGDFNIRSTEPDSYSTIFSHLVGAKDSHEAGHGPLEGTTRNAKYPKKRIDYLLTFNGVEAVSTIVDPAGASVSDHLAVFGTVSLRKPNCSVPGA